LRRGYRDKLNITKGRAGHGDIASRINTVPTGRRQQNARGRHVQTDRAGEALTVQPLFDVAAFNLPMSSSAISLRVSKLSLSVVGGGRYAYF